jgi:hypothetical protein
MLARMAILALATSVPSTAQWLNFPTSGIPRLPDGKPDLAAPTPKTFDGKPDLSGIWRSDPAEDGFTYARNIAADLRPEEIRSWAATVAAQRAENLQKDAPWVRCLPVGMPLNETTSVPYRIVQTHGLVFIFHEEFDTSPRQIFTDGRKFPDDPNPTWMGYSVGKWEGETLVVETSGFNDKTWLDQMGHPHSESLRLTERFHRLDFGRMTLQITIEDPKAFTRPITLTRHPRLLPDYDMLESICLENERDSQHMVGK